MTASIDESSKKEVAQKLAHILSDSYVLYFKTHQFHWNVTGPFANSAPNADVRIDTSATWF